MSTKLNDVSNQSTLGTSVQPMVASSSQNGSSIDLLPADGPCFALLMVGAVESGTTVGGKVQESADGSSWSDISGATFASTTTSNAKSLISFRRTLRYARCVVTVTGVGAQAAISAILGEQKKFL